MEHYHDENLALVLPKNYVPIEKEEMKYIEGGTLAALAAIATIVAGGYKVGEVVGEKAYYAGLSNEQYQEIKWGMRGSTGMMAFPVGIAFQIGFENKYYEKVTGE